VHNVIRSLACVLLLVSGAAFAQHSTSWMSAQWTPLTEQNARAQQAADTAFKADVEADYQARVAAAKNTHPARNQGDSGVSASADQNAPIPSGMKGLGDPRGHGRMPEPPTVTSIDKLVPSSLDFAAPPNAGLILQRMTGAVVFGRTDSDALVMIPLSGQADLPHGMRGEMMEEGDQLRLRVQMPNGQVVEFRYLADPDAAGGGLVVDIKALGAVAARDVEFRRVYRRAQVNVGELKKAGE
jgi:hypothetical protein